MNKFHSKDFLWLKFFIILTGSLFVSSKTYSKTVNSLAAVVGDIAITRIDLDDHIKKLRRIGKIKSRRKLSHHALDSLIDKAIIEYTAKQESIIVSEERIKNELQKEKKARGFQSDKELEKFIRKNFRMNLNAYKKRIKFQIMGQQVAQVRVRPSPPSDREIKNWYSKHSKLYKYKYNYRIISIPFKQNNLKDEERANKAILKAKSLAVSNFARAAALYSKHPSRKSGGRVGWQLLDEIAQSAHPFLAELVLRTPTGKVSDEYSIGNAYYLVKVEQKRKTNLEEISPQIRNILYSKKQQEGFQKWLVNERRRLSIRVFLPGYRSP